MKPPIKDKDVLDRLRAAGSADMQVILEYLGADRSAQVLADQRPKDGPGAAK